MNVEKEQTGNPGAIHHGRVNGERERNQQKLRLQYPVPLTGFKRKGRQSYQRPMFCNIIFLALGWRLLHSENS